VTYPPVDGYIIAIRKTSSYEVPYTKHYVRDAQRCSHVVDDIHEQYPYEVKMAAFNAFGEGKYTRTIVVGKANSIHRFAICIDRHLCNDFSICIDIYL
jgi:hypothetical protein